jgi:hypothetical protein
MLTVGDGLDRFCPYDGNAQVLGDTVVSHGRLGDLSLRTTQQFLLSLAKCRARFNHVDRLDALRQVLEI